MKMTRQDLKHLVKECLVEILSEGLVETTKTINENRRAQPALEQRQVQTPRAAPMRQSVADKISFLPSRNDIAAQQAPARQPRQSAAADITNDPILAEVFADTERAGRHLNITESSSSPHRVSYEEMVSVGGDAAAKKMLRSDPADIFGEATSKWAALAFAEKSPAGSRAG